MTAETQPTLTAPAPKERHPRALYRRYLYVLLGVAALAYALPLILLRLPGYSRWSGSPIGRAMEYDITTPHIDADVIIIGDSAALLGFDPAVLSKDLGLKVINLAETMQGYALTTDLELRHYLAQNKPPRLIVFYSSPWDTDFANTPIPSYYDGEEMLFRHGSATEIAHFARHNIRQVLAFPMVFYEINTVKSNRRVPLPYTTDGHERGFHPARRLAPGCALVAEFTTRSHTMESTREALARYRKPGTATLYFAAPVPACKGVDEVMTLPFADVNAAPPRVLNPHDVSDDDAFAHIDQSLVAQVTADLEAAIRKTLNLPAN